MIRFFKGFYLLLSSYGLACTILLLLCLLTYLGTIAQVHMGVYQAQKLYFESLVVWQPVAYGLKFPLPGVLLLLVVFSLNILLGGLMRLRRKPSHIGLFIVHSGILFLLLGGFVTYKMGISGQMTLAPGQTSDRFESYTDWELVAIDTTPPDRDVEYAIPQNAMSSLKEDQSRTFRYGALPFDLEVNAWFPNAQVLPKGPMFKASNPVINGFFVQPAPLSDKAEQNLPAAYVTIVDKQSGQPRREILWGNSLAPLTVDAGASKFALLLRHVTWRVPFAIELKQFIHEVHPGTTIPSRFQSDVVKVTADARQDVSIRMNEPLRTNGYVFFQASFLEDPRSGIVSSTLAVAKNPADQWPLYSCIIITFGLLVHFGQKLARHLKRAPSRERAAGPQPQAKPTRTREASA